MIVAVTNEEHGLIGCVIPPDEFLMDSRAKDDSFWTLYIKERWNEFKENNPEFETDDEFLDYLEKYYDFTQPYETIVHVTL